MATFSDLYGRESLDQTKIGQYPSYGTNFGLTDPVEASLNRAQLYADERGEMARYKLLRGSGMLPTPRGLSEITAQSAPAMGDYEARFGMAPPSWRTADGNLRPDTISSQSEWGRGLAPGESISKLSEWGRGLAPGESISKLSEWGQAPRGSRRGRQARYQETLPPTLTPQQPTMQYGLPSPQGQQYRAFGSGQQFMGSGLTQPPMSNEERQDKPSRYYSGAY